MNRVAAVYQAHAAAGARFQKESHCIVKLVTNVSRSAVHSWQLITPQLIYKSVSCR